MRIHNETLRSCLRFAYGVREFQIAGGPKWMDGERYDIDAKANGPAEDPQLATMLQSLLAERFKLAVHRGTKPFQGYALVVAKKGLKIKPIESDGHIRYNSRPGSLTARQISMPELSRRLSMILGLPVVDDTKVPGIFAFRLEWTPDAHKSTPSGGGLDTSPPTGSAEDAGGPSPSLFTALDEQLGVKLEARKVPLEIIIVDHLEKPTGN